MIPLGQCPPQAVPFPTVFGAKFLSVNTALVQNFSAFVSSRYYSNHPDINATNLTFCNVTVTHTHPGQNDTIITRIYLPIRSAWNGRFQGVGGGGWVAGLFELSDTEMIGAVAEGYATMSTNGGLPSYEPDDWALLSPGNVNLYALQDLASVSLNDGTLIAKSIIKSFYGQPPKFSYWSGCSQGGRQGLMLAQRYPAAYDGIAAASPAVNWAHFFISAHFLQQLMNELGQYPHSCELEALTAAAIKACDGNDGLVDGLISDPDACHFDPNPLVGSPLNCSAPGAPTVISKAAAAVANGAWNGATTSNGSFLWYTSGYEAPMGGEMGNGMTSCNGDGKCVGRPQDFFTQWLRLFIHKNTNFNVSSMTRQDYEQAFQVSVREYDSIIGTSYPDLSEFRKAGGKMVTYHGLVSNPIFPSTQFLRLVLKERF